MADENFIMTSVQGKASCSRRLVILEFEWKDYSYLKLALLTKRTSKSFLKHLRCKSSERTSLQLP